jgi:hypothetical protein
MGGQACVFYGAAEFSRDLDLLVLADSQNLTRLRLATDELQAHSIAVPHFGADYLRRGHSVHFRCRREDVAGLCIDVMSTLRGTASFEDLWDRRTSIEAMGEIVDLLALEDLVLAKKTQRDKDWPMIRRLVEQSYFSGNGEKDPPVEFWLRELRTPELLIAVAAEYPELARRAADTRPSVRAALAGSLDDVTRLLAEEEQQERRRDREYWDPLRRELEQLRRTRNAE